MQSRILAAVAAALLYAPTVLVAQEAPGDMADARHDVPESHAHDMDHMDDPAVRAFMEANERMHEDMMIEFTGDPDIDFMRGMIPHHQGAIDMARVVLEHGQEPEVRALAEEIIEAQEAEIEMMRTWLEERGHSAH